MKPALLCAAGYGLERLGCRRAALKLYEAASAAARRAATASEARWLQPAQFFGGRARRRLGLDAPDDPLYACSLGPRGERHGRVGGRFDAEAAFSGLQLAGAIAGVSTGFVTLYVDAKPVRAVAVVRKGPVGVFSYRLTRRSLRLLPHSFTLGIADSGGRPLAPLRGGRALAVENPLGGDGPSALLEGRRALDKKGSPLPTPEELDEDRKAFLTIYGQAREALRARLGLELFLAYGTLLGYYREGGFIPGDDDFDTGFFSRANDPEGAKAESAAVVRALVDEGFAVSFNRRGRLFRLHGRDTGFAGPHIDVHVFWAQDGYVYAHNDFRAAQPIGDYLPAKAGEFLGRSVYIPAKPERFLEAHYGPGWRTPDPAFVNYFAGKDAQVLRTLSRALLSPGEYRALRAELRSGNREGRGDFLSLGWDDLYPLPPRDEYLE